MPGRVLDSKEVNMGTGWIRSYRSLLEWEWWEDLNVSRLWITILLSVNYEQKSWKGQVIEPGQMVTSYASLAKKSCLSIQEVRTALNKLKSTGEITYTTTHKNTLITVVKWADFQGDDRSTNTVSNTIINEPSTQNQHSTNTVPTQNQQQLKKEINKEGKEGKKERNIFIKPTLEEVTTYINENMFCVDPDAFYDYYEANGWTISGKAHMKDWKATVRNWDRREQKNKRPKNKELAF